jgi:hypothetical protein
MYAEIKEEHSDESLSRQFYVDLTKTEENKDFGKGFYVTNIRKHAERWDERIAAEIVFFVSYLKTGEKSANAQKWN